MKLSDIQVTGTYKLMRKNGKLKRVHREVLHNVDPRDNEDELVCHHIDGNKANNSPENLVWMTRTEHLRLHKTGKHRPNMSGNLHPNYKTGEFVGGKISCSYQKRYNTAYYEKNRETLLAKQKARDAEKREWLRVYQRIHYWTKKLQEATSEERKAVCKTQLEKFLVMKEELSYE